MKKVQAVFPPQSFRASDVLIYNLKKYSKKCLRKYTGVPFSLTSGVGLTPGLVDMKISYVSFLFITIFHKVIPSNI